MANGPNDYRDPKVTDTGRKSSSWLWWLIGAIILLLLLGWLLGWFGGNDVEVTETEAVVVEEPADGAVVVEEGEAVDPAAVEAVEGEEVEVAD